MEKESHGMVRRGEEGSALTIVLIAVLILLPLSLILTAMILKWQRQSAEFRDGLSMEYAARAGLAEAFNRISAARFSLGPNENTDFEMNDAGSFQVRVRVSRTQDVILSLDGRAVEGPEASSIDLEQTAVDPDLRRVHLYRKLDVYHVEARVSSKPGWVSVRLSSILIRPEKGALQQVGLRVERGYLGEEDNVGSPQR
jgi:hypothetical protein